MMPKHPLRTNRERGSLRRWRGVYLEYLRLMVRQESRSGARSVWLERCTRSVTVRKGYRAERHTIGGMICAMMGEIDDH